jgi:CRISPR/Cas system CSM-associated protein Csm5 (group 7 of RAMP superfamily)
MELNKIKEIIDSSITDSLKIKLILGVIADSDDAIPHVLEMLNSERSKNKEVIKDMNLELSRADSFVGCRDRWKGELFEKQMVFLQEEIAKFYEKYNDTKGVFHCFKP